VSQQLAEVETLFLHEARSDYTVVATRDGNRILRGRLELKERLRRPATGQVPCHPRRRDHPRQPGEFVDLARAAGRIRISEQTSPKNRKRLQAMLDGYQLEAMAVRTCRRCANDGRYGPITSDGAIEHNDELICRDCARRELERELSYKGEFTGAAEERLEELLYESGDLDRIVNLLQGGLDPDLTKYDEVSANVDDISPVRTEDLDLHRISAHLQGRFEELLPVQSLSVRNGLLDGTDQLVVSATATGKTLVGELAGIDRALKGDGKLLFSPSRRAPPTRSTRTSKTATATG